MSGSIAEGQRMGRVGEDRSAKQWALSTSKSSNQLNLQREKKDPKRRSSAR